jgi:hypothetical protein
VPAVPPCGPSEHRLQARVVPVNISWREFASVFSGLPGSSERNPPHRRRLCSRSLVFDQTERAPTMKRVLPATLAMAITLAVVLAPGSTARAGPIEDPEGIINSLKANGYRVIVTRVGSDHPSQCTVQSVSQQSAVTNVQPGRNMRNQPTSLPTVSHKIAYVTLAC